MRKPSHKTNRYAIEVENLSVAFDKTNIIDDVSFQVKTGDIAAVIGPNGSGKTTLIKAILGLTPVKSGHITLLGKNLRDARVLVGYVPQKFSFEKEFPITVKEFLELATHKHASKTQNIEHIDEAIKEVGLTPAILTKQLGTLSGGQLQRVLIAQAIMHRPSILMLDEPSAGIDVAGEQAFYDVLHHLNEDHGTTIVLVSHDISMVMRRVDQVICINKQLLCMGPPQKALSEKNLRRLFGEDTSVFTHHDHDHGHE